MKDEQFNTLVDLINLVQTNLTTRMDDLSKKLEETKEELRAEFKSDMENLKIELRAEFKSDMEDLRKEFKSETKEIKEEQKSMSAEMQEMKEDIKDIKETLKENEIKNHKQHAFMIDLIQRQKTSVI